ncbi:MAG: sel1 repeat family protein [Candidatus Competibacteraceae bacterium]|nr:sel1 repeat family protein [Candidatus Competibacteraceae bacterium]
MNTMRRAGFARMAWLCPLLLVACGEPEQEIIPVLVPPSPEVQRQAAAGEAAAQFAMADYHLGDEDPAVMLRWLRSSACQGYAIAQASLGVLYDAGDGVPQDAFMAYAWWTWAGRQGDPEAATFAARQYAAMADDERAFAETLLQDGWMATPDCRNR